MSLVSDMLSKVNMPQPTRETPPGLRSDISLARRKKVRKPYKIALALSIFIAFMIFVIAFLYQMFIVAAEDQKIAKDLYKLKSTHKERLAKKNESLSQKIEDALKVPPKQAEKVPATSDKGSAPSDKKSIFAKGPAPALIAIASIDESGDNKTGKAKTKSVTGKKSPLDVRKAGTPEDKPVVESNTPPVEEEKKEPVLGSKEIYHFLYKADRSERKNDYLDAISIYQDILKVEPQNYIIMNKIASLLMNMSMWKEAMNFLRQSYEVTQDHTPTMINIGVVYANTGNFSRAEKYLLKVLDPDPINQDAVFNIALLYEKQMRYDKAAEYYSRLGKLGDSRGVLGLERVLSYTD